MKKRILSILLTGVLATGLLAGCGQNNEKQGQNKETQQSVSETQQSVSEEEVVEEPVELTWVMIGAKPADEELAAVQEAVNAITEEKIGVTLTLEFLDYGDFDGKMNMYHAAGGTDFDICFTCNWANDYTTNSGRGAFADLTDLIATATPELAATMPEYYLNAMKVDGRIYGIPNRQILSAGMAVYIRKDYADKYGLDVEALAAKPYIDETDLMPFFEDVLSGEEGVYIQGDANCALMSDRWRWADRQVDIPGTNMCVLPSDKSKAVYPYVPGNDFYDAEVQAAKELNEWIEKGYVPSDVATITADEVSLGFASGKYIMYTAGSGSNMHGQLVKTYDTEAYCLWISTQIFDTPSVKATATAISAACEYPEKALQVIELANTDSEFFNLLALGIEDVHYTLNEQGQWSATENTGYVNSGWAIGNTFIGYETIYQEPGFNKQAEIINDEAEKNILKSFVFDQSSVEAQLIAMGDVSAEMGSRWIAGDVDEFYAELYEKLMAAGMGDVQAEVQRQLDIFLSEQQ